MATKAIVKRVELPKWYTALVTDLRQLAFEGIVKTKHAIGVRILRDELKFNKPEYGSKRIKNLAKDLQVTGTELYACIQFARKYPEISTAVENLSWREIRKLLPARKPENQNIPEFPPGKYGIIYADPPWKYWESGYKNQSQHYDTLTNYALAKLTDKKGRPITDLPATNCILFLWATFPILRTAFELINEWGFIYSTCGFVWVKSKKDGTGFAFGCGSWTRANAELCLIAIKGHISRLNKSIPQIVYERRQEHSAKPAIVGKHIIALVGDLPRIELFARTKTSGWDVWGDEI